MENGDRSNGQAGDLRLDAQRSRRTGEPEAVYGPGKTPEQCAAAVEGLLAAGAAPVLVTRADADQADAVAARVPEAGYDPDARLVVARPAGPADGRVVVVTAGTGDLPVARECRGVLAAFGLDAELIADVGVAGVHRVLEVQPRLDAADVVVAVAGMEGALPTAVAGLVAAPVVAVPTSVGHGAAFEGVTALLSMLTACAPGVVVVNIDGGFSAALAARRILRAAAAAGQARAEPGAPETPA